MPKLPKFELNLEAEIVLVTGDRNWGPYVTIGNWLDKFKKLELVINGGAAGADKFSTFYADARQILYLVVPAKWNKQGKAAGPIRNSAMLEWIAALCESKYENLGPEFVVQVLAFHTDIKYSKGTRDMILKAYKAGYKVWLVDKYED